MFSWLRVLLSNENGRVCAAAGVLPVRIGSAGCGIVLCAAVDDVDDVADDVLYVVLSQTLSGRGEQSRGNTRSSLRQSKGWRTRD